MPQSRVRRLVNKTQFAPHQFAVGVDTFPRLNLDHISRDLRLVELGAERGTAAEPPQSEEGFDDVEDRVINYIRHKHAEALSAFEEQRQLYNQRLAKLGFHTVLAAVEEAAKSACAEMDAEALKAKDLASELRRNVDSTQFEWEGFRRQHELTRPAHYPQGLGAWVLRVGILLAILLGEAALNSSFFAKGSDYGLLGGALVAVMVAAVNVGLGVAAGFFPARWIEHRTLRPLGVLGLALWGSVAVLFNFGVAHYRTALESMSADPETLARANFFAHPLDLGLHSWWLLGIGLAFTTVAMLDGRSMDDHYPGYGAVDRHLEEAKQAYIDERRALLDAVRQIYDDALEEVATRAAQISKRHDESETIRTGLEALKVSFEAHLQYLEEAANGLIEIYRDANRKARPPRTTPASFRKRWRRDFPAAEANTAPAFSNTSLATLTRRGEERRRQGERRLEKARTAAAEVFPPLGETV